MKPSEQIPYMPEYNAARNPNSPTPVAPLLVRCSCGKNASTAKYVHEQSAGMLDNIVFGCECGKMWDLTYFPDALQWDTREVGPAYLELLISGKNNPTRRDAADGTKWVGHQTDGYVTLDSGKRVDYSTGARRDTDENKPRFGLIPVRPLTRLADLYTRGAVKYGDSNWQKGIPTKRYYDSMLRHAYAWASGETTEDHLAAVAWNAFAIMWTMEQIEAGKLPDELDNMKDGDSPA